VDLGKSRIEQEEFLERERAAKKRVGEVGSEEGL
jgi:hypothetical protein